MNREETRDSELPVRGDMTREQSRGEEIANSVSHGIGLLLAIAALPILVVTAARNGSAAEVVGASIFGATMVLLYLTSPIYHVVTAPRAKRVLRIIDHSASYLLIAGTYTPFTLGVLRGPWGWTLFGLIWGLAGAGLLLKAFAGTRFPVLSTWLYILMGWLVIIAIKPLWDAMPAWGLFWLVAGGLSYTLGVAFYVVDERVRYTHFVWHLFVMTGSICHFLAVLFYAG
jgi:hemolysin III